MAMRRKAILALADGTVFFGRAFGAETESIGEVVFNTSMTGYQETLTDPSYEGQIVTFTYPELGNVGVNDQDEESSRPHAVGAIVKHAALGPSSYRASAPLQVYLEKHGLPGIEGIDTRMLVRHLRDNGSQMGVLSTLADADADALVEKARAAPSMEGLDLATPVTTKVPYEFETPMGDPLCVCWSGGAPCTCPQAPDARFHVVAYDYGLKRSMLRLLVDAGCKVTVVPAHTPATEALARKPDGIFLSNGPGDPAAVAYAQPIIRELLGQVPIMGICLGHQILALAVGAKTYKLKFGHRGANQPVKELSSGRIEITAQNHGFAVDEASLAGTGARVTHVSLNDGTVEGIELPEKRAFSVQYHPESSPGPHDSRSLFSRFVSLMEAAR